MQGKDCKTCGLNAPVCTVYGVCDWQPSELYTVYLAERERAEKLAAAGSKLIATVNINKEQLEEIAEQIKKELSVYVNGLEAQNERFRKALNCPRCGGCGEIRREYINSTCPDCSEIRKEARGE